jgi:NADPH2:quinone reductase
MQAAYIEKTGPPEVIQFGQLPDPPPPGPTEVLVRVRAVAVNPIDTYVRSGAVAAKLNFPFIIGCDLAGTVEKCGAQVKQFHPGSRVWGSNQGMAGRPGSFAEYAVVDEKWLYPTPEGARDAEMVAGALVGITAHLGLFLHAQLQPGEIVFVNGGTGGVGAAVVQLAKAAGAKVIATVGSVEKQALCQQWGADLVLDYHSETLDDDIRKFAAPAGGINVWFETQREPNPARTIAFMARRGRIVVMAGRTARPEFPIGPFYVNDLRMIGFAMFNASAAEQRACAATINALSKDGKWHPHVGRLMQLSEAAAAHRLQEENTIERRGTLTGKIVLEV